MGWIKKWFKSIRNPTKVEEMVKGQRIWPEVMENRPFYRIVSETGETVGTDMRYAERISVDFMSVSSGKVKEMVGSLRNNPVTFRSGIRYMCSMDFRCFSY
jgi:hypothetical protein